MNRLAMLLTLLAVGLSGCSRTGADEASAVKGDKPWNWVDEAKHEGVAGMLYESSSRYHVKLAYRQEENHIVSPPSKFLPAPTEVPEKIRNANTLTKQDIDEFARVYDKALIMKALRTYDKPDSLISEVYVSNPPMIPKPGNEHIGIAEDKVSVRVIFNDKEKKTSTYNSTMDMELKVVTKEYKKALLNIFNMRHLSSPPMKIPAQKAFGSASATGEPVEMQKVSPAGIGYLIQLLDEEYTMLINGTVRYSYGDERPTMLRVEVRDIHNDGY